MRSGDFASGPGSGKALQLAPNIATFPGQRLAVTVNYNRLESDAVFAEFPARRFKFHDRELAALVGREVRVKTVRLTAAQAAIRFLQNQFSERDGSKVRFFGGCLGIFGHGNVAGIGQALEQDAGLRYYLFRNEQAMVHAAIGFAKTSFRKRALVCTTSVGPGATNMVTGAATATVNRLPVLLLPGDVFARRNVAPVCSNWSRVPRKTFRRTIVSSRFRATGIAFNAPSNYSLHCRKRCEC